MPDGRSSGGPVQIALPRVRRPGAMLLFLALTGCVSEQPRPTIRPSTPAPESTVPELEEGARLDRDLVAKDVRRFEVDGEATWVVDLHNMASYSRQVFYRPVWVDGRGQIFGTEEPWIEREMSAFEVFTLRFRAPATSRSFRLEIAKRREERAPER